MIDKKGRIAYYKKKLFALHIYSTVQTEQAIHTGVILSMNGAGPRTRQQMNRKNLWDSLLRMFHRFFLCKRS